MLLGQQGQRLQVRRDDPIVWCRLDRRRHVELAVELMVGRGGVS